MEYLKILKTSSFTPHNFVLANCDTDSIAFRKSDGSDFDKNELDSLVSEINAIMPERIVWDNEGKFRRFIVVAAKNYLLDDGKTIKIKGASLKATMREPALKDFISEILELLRTDRQAHIFDLYRSYALKIVDLKDISQWCFKKTITKSILEPERTQEARVLAALKGSVFSEGDRVFLYFKTEEEYALREKFDGTYCRETLLRKLYNTLKIFSKIIDISLFPNYALKRNLKLIGTE